MRDFVQRPNGEIVMFDVNFSRMIYEFFSSYCWRKIVFRASFHPVQKLERIPKKFFSIQFIINKRQLFAVGFFLGNAPLLSNAALKFKWSPSRRKEIEWNLIYVANLQKHSFIFCFHQSRFAGALSTACKLTQPQLHNLIHFSFFLIFY